MMILDDKCVIPRKENVCYQSKENRDALDGCMVQSRLLALKNAIFLQYKRHYYFIKNRIFITFQTVFIYSPRRIGAILRKASLNFHKANLLYLFVAKRFDEVVVFRGDSIHQECRCHSAFVRLVGTKSLGEQNFIRL